MASKEAKHTPAQHLEQITTGYTFDEPSIQLGAAIVDSDVHAEAAVRLPLAMMNRHGLVSGATGTGKTITLQVIAEQLSAHGVPVFLADIKGDLTGLSTPGTGAEKLLKRTQSVGQSWAAQSFPVEYFSLGGDGVGVPIRATISDFGPLLLARVLDLNETQESSLQLVFHYADKADLELFNLADLRAVISFLVSDDGKDALENLGGLSKATAGVILRELITLEAQGMDRFFGEPEFDTADLLRSDAEGRGIISCLELPTLQQKPQLFSTFLMWLVADLFADLPEVGDIDKPKLVFFLDEAHLLFNGASKAFLQSIQTTVRLIRSKGVGIFFVTQTPRDVPAEVLGQLANRVQHALRAFTPDDAKALKSTVSTFPISPYDLEEVLTSAGIGEAVVTVMNEKGAPTPVAWTRMFSPQSTMGPSPAGVVEGIVTASPLLADYGTPIDSHSAFEKLSASEPASTNIPAEPGTTETGTAEPRTTAAPPPVGTPPRGRPSQAEIDAEARRIEEDILGRPSSRPPTTRREQPAPENGRAHPPAPPAGQKQQERNEMMDFALKTAGTIGVELVRGLFATQRRRRRRRW
ncbi:ATPase [Arthrobacter sp. Soil782]|uniref:helicase HerA-like domain-containing protein n=1 Tax=Arthrobacter sp. Soil782 TaxID=1736410 RepID=UPI0006F75E4E|nr:helicase HerA-like domain-containing protein [Arthrobacter sp. Soil782]KRF08564.1 ATPase [Arthrobacter sp. Soil782]